MVQMKLMILKELIMISEFLNAKARVLVLSLVPLLCSACFPKVDPEMDEIMGYSVAVYELHPLSIKAVSKSKIKVDEYAMLRESPHPIDVNDFAIGIFVPYEGRSISQSREHIRGTHVSQLEKLRKEYRKDAKEANEYYTSYIIITSPALVDYGLSDNALIFADEVIDGRAPGSDLSDLVSVCNLNERNRVLCSYPDFKWKKNIYSECSFSEYFAKGNVLAFPVGIYLCFKNGVALPAQFTLHMKFPLFSDDSTNAASVLEASFDVNK